MKLNMNGSVLDQAGSLGGFNDLAALGSDLRTQRTHGCELPDWPGSHRSGGRSSNLLTAGMSCTSPPVTTDTLRNVVESASHRVHRTRFLCSVLIWFFDQDNRCAGEKREIYRLIPFLCDHSSGRVAGRLANRVVIAADPRSRYPSVRHAEPSSIGNCGWTAEGKEV
jgi:hypothetical protein